MKFQDLFYIVLVEPEDCLNIGCVARAMLNCGFTNLILVNPKNYNQEKASWSACWGEKILKSATVYDNLAEALADKTDVVGFTARSSRDRRNHYYLQAWGESLNSFPDNSKIALLFGNERTGLLNEQIKFCSTLVRIPSSEENPSYNLAQAVLLTLFELYRKNDTNRELVEVRGKKVANVGQIQYLEKLVIQTLEQVEFYREDSSPAVRRVVSNLIRRIHPDQRELGILLAIFDSLVRETKKKQI